MLKLTVFAICVFVACLPSFGQDKSVWVVHNGEMVEYDSATFAPKQTVKLPPEAKQSPASLSVNRKGQILFAPAAALPVPEGELGPMQRVWLWNGTSGAWMERGVRRDTSAAGSNTAITESAPQPALSADGARLYWFANEARRLQRDGVDLSTGAQWAASSSGLDGKDRQEIARTTFKDCRCSTGTCEETCAHGEVVAPAGGIEGAFLYSEVISGQTQTLYKSSARYSDEAGKWSASAIAPPLRRVLDVSGQAVIEAVPDTGCCGWENQSNDQTFLRLTDKTMTVFDEQVSFDNSDYDVSFFTSNAKLSPGMTMVAMTIAATALPNHAIQLAEQGQADPKESLRIRKAVGEMPAVEVKSVVEAPKRVAYLPHATLIGWISEKEVLIMEDHLLVAYNVGSGTRRKSSVRVEDAEHVLLP